MTSYFDRLPSLHSPTLVMASKQINALFTDSEKICWLENIFHSKQMNNNNKKMDGNNEIKDKGIGNQELG